MFDGVKPFAPSLDHVGPIARTVEDLRISVRRNAHSGGKRSRSNRDPYLD